MAVSEFSEKRSFIVYDTNMNMNVSMNMHEHVKKHFCLHSRSSGCWKV